MTVDYYALLDIPSQATQAEIKSAYRRKVKELHPDTGGGLDTGGGDRERFLAVQQAYEVLSDPARRRAYDARALLAREKRGRRPGVAPLWRQMVTERRAEPLRSASFPVEPLIPDVPIERDWDRDDWWSADARRGVRTRRGFPDQEATSFSWGDGDDWGDSIYVEVSLTPEQARYGGRVEVRVSLPVTCPVCRGQGGRGLAMCPRCAGGGRIVQQRPLLLSFPGNVVDGDVARLSLAQVGIPDALLTVLFLVEGW